MDETPIQFQDQSAGEAQGSAQSVTPEQGKGPEYLTRSDLVAAFDEWNRRQQGLRKKQENRIKSEVQRMINAAKEAGTEVTPQLQAAFERQAAAQAADQEPDDEQEVTPKPAPAKEKPTAGAVQTPAAHWVVQAQADIEKQLNVVITTADEGADELAELRKNNDPVGYIAKYRELAQQKAQAQESSESQSAKVRIPTGAVGGVAGSVNADAYRQEMFAARGNPDKVRAVKEKYRKAGLDVDHVNLFKS